MTELFHDHHMLVLPVSTLDLERIINTSSVAPLLNGYR
ncbi:MAG: hypothetical protein H6765_00335 [Candidatus Peribacteria bacterium]|nr:MAG: hypothetical protein H6765_00335 [Candidatus Peribacteria bacterium]